MRNYPVVTDAHAHVKTKAEALERIREGIPTMVCGTDPEDARWVMELCHMPEAVPNAFIRQAAAVVSTVPAAIPITACLRLLL